MVNDFSCTCETKVTGNSDVTQAHWRKMTDCYKLFGTTQ